jgi:RimJ/RimL family protein N-acetyltransferase
VAPSLVLTTDRLVLRPLRVTDADDLHAVLHDTALHRFTGGSPATLPELRDRLLRWEAGGPDNGSERWLNWIARRRDDDAAVAHLQATVRGDHADLAWVVGTPWQGQGYATEAARAVAATLRSAGVVHLHAHIHPDHLASQHVATAVGLAPTDHQDPDGETLWSTSGCPHFS